MSEILKETEARYKSLIPSEDAKLVENIYREHVLDRQRITELIDYTKAEGNQILKNKVEAFVILFCNVFEIFYFHRMNKKKLLMPLNH